jgi:CheY-like chemotaxis protein
MDDLPCLIILDINMPGMNGVQVLEEIKKDKILASLPLVVYSTSSEKGFADLIESQEIEFITKPKSSSNLNESVTKMLRHCSFD